MNILIHDIPYKIHPLCELFPYMDDPTFAVLKEDMKKYGQRDTIKLFKEDVIDGKNRLMACKEIDIEPRIENLPEDTDIVAYVKSVGLCRRDLTPDQRIDIAEKILDYSLEQEGKKEKIEELKKDPQQAKIIEEKQIKQISIEANSNPITVRQYRKIKQKADKEQDKIAIQEKQKIKEGRTSVKKAYEQIFPKIRKRKEIEQTKEDLRQELITIKEEKILLETKMKQIINILLKYDLWKTVKKEIYPIMENIPSLEPTIEELRKAGLL